MIELQRQNTVAQPTQRDASGPPVFVRERRRGWRAVHFAELVEYRDLLVYLVLRDVKVLYRQTILGVAWAFLRPFFSMIVFSVVFGRLAKVPSDGIPYPVFAYAALVPWTYFQTSLTQATTSLIQSTGLFTKVYFPRVYIPMTPILAGLLDFAIALIMVGGLMIWFRIPPTGNLVFIPVLVFLMVLCTAGGAFWLSALGVQYRDVRFAIQFVAQLLMYAAPVVWPASLVPRKLRVLYGLYPMAGVIEGFRSALLGRRPMPWDLLIPGSIAALALVTTGFLYFRRVEGRLADVA